VVLGDLLDQVIERNESNLAKGREIAPWPSSTTRWCTSDQKTSQVGKLITSLAAEFAHADGTPVRILNCLGIRAQESSARAKKVEFGVESSNGKRHVDRWLPIFHWTTTDVWATVKASGLPYHTAYDQGMERLSCCFCVLATKGDLIIAAKHNPALAEEYAAVERKVGWRFTDKLSMADIIEAAEASR
jgi:3'-phosphoadenosine 5'-phosphosulfate sulfotransferase (PAPS reductase)/FAD synthetase